MILGPRFNPPSVNQMLYGYPMVLAEIRLTMACRRGVDDSSANKDGDSKIINYWR